jgi:hypothetical protein
VVCVKQLNNRAYMTQFVHKLQLLSFYLWEFSKGIDLLKSHTKYQTTNAGSVVFRDIGMNKDLES